MRSFKDHDIYYRTAQVMKLLSGLKLNVLTSLGDKQPDVSYQTLKMLIRHSNAWKELRYISHSSQFLDYKDNMMLFGPSDYSMADLYLRQPQPFDWHSALERGDGQASSPYMTIYRSKEAKSRHAVLLPGTSAIFTQAFAAAQNKADCMAEVKRQP